MSEVGRRSFLKTIGSAGLVSALPEAAFGAMPHAGELVHETADVGRGADLPKYSVRFAVAGMSHDHIYGMVEAMIRGGGVLVSCYAAEPDRRAAFAKRYPAAKMVDSMDAVMNDSSVKLVLSSTIPNERAGVGIRAMKHGKDFLSDKPGMTTLEQLAEVRKTIAETNKIYAIMYSERLEVKAAVKAGSWCMRGRSGRLSRRSTLRRTR